MAKRETEVKKAKIRVQMRPLKNSVSRKTALVKVVEKAKKSAAKIELITSVRRQGVPFTGSSYEIKIAPPINNNIPHHCQPIKSSPKKNLAKPKVKMGIRPPTTGTTRLV